MRVGVLVLCGLGQYFTLRRTPDQLLLVSAGFCAIFVGIGGFSGAPGGWSGRTDPPAAAEGFFLCAADDGEGEEKSGDEADKGVSTFGFYPASGQTQERRSARAAPSAILTAPGVRRVNIAPKRCFESIYYAVICSPCPSWGLPIPGSPGSTASDTPRHCQHFWQGWLRRDSH